ncbi:hypothetical protein NM688_g3895 [Phlebia brevispora]|uniref:Uncharacterized protein n=1 Tax=Phlebia brevispora TaxID=194682 RepID=A0ACC1T4N1_9APHY|nr:hypothetical protein NM688_g3895 [Phlebia brevispora]
MPNGARPQVVQLVPPELLIKIFLELVLSSFYLTDAKQPSLYSWIPPVTRVCRRWRAIALQAHELWSYIHAIYPDPRIALCIARSGDAPLSVIAIQADRRNPEIAVTAFRTVLPHLGRIRRLVMVGGRLCEELQSATLRDHSASLLESLEVTESPRNPRRTIPHDAAQNPPLFLTQPLPRLKTFMWHGWQGGTSFVNVVGSNLRVLDLAFTPSAARLTWVQWLSFLEIVPQLEDLLLTLVVSPAPASTDGAVLPVSLPCLSHLAMHFIFLTDADNLLQHLMLPSNTRVEISVSNFGINVQDHLRLIAAIESQLSRMLTRVDLKKRSADLLLMEFNASVIAVDVKHTTTPPPNVCMYSRWLDKASIPQSGFRLHLRGAVDRRSANGSAFSDALFKRVCQMLDRVYLLQDFQTLMIKEGQGREPDWDDEPFILPPGRFQLLKEIVLEKMTDLQTLVLKSPDIWGFATKLLSPMPSGNRRDGLTTLGDVGSSTPLLFPSLNSVSILKRPSMYDVIAHDVPPTLDLLRQQRMVYDARLVRCHFCAIGESSYFPLPGDKRGAGPCQGGRTFEF